MNHRITALAACVALGATTVGGIAGAQPAIALTGARTLAVIDVETGQFMGGFNVPGTARLLAIDWRPADQRLYALAASGEILRVDLDALTAETVSTTSILLPEGGPVAMDFDPAEDMLRLTSGRKNHRVDPDTGEVAVEGDLQLSHDADGAAPMIVATAYSNASGAPVASVQYGVDAGLGALVRTTPETGVATPIGRLGIAAAATYAFDIGTGPDGINTAWLAADGLLHTVSLEDGSVTATWALPAQAGEVRDIAILSHM